MANKTQQDSSVRSPLRKFIAISLCLLFLFNSWPATSYADLRPVDNQTTTIPETPVSGTGPSVVQGAGQGGGLGEFPENPLLPVEPQEPGEIPPGPDPGPEGGVGTNIGGTPTRNLDSISSPPESYSGVNPAAGVDFKRITYTAQGRVRSVAYFDAWNNRRIREDIYNQATGALIETRYFNGSGTPFRTDRYGLREVRSGNRITRREYSLNGRVVRIEYYNNGSRNHRTMFHDPTGAFIREDRLFYLPSGRIQRIDSRNAGGQLLSRELYNSTTGALQNRDNYYEERTNVRNQRTHFLDNGRVEFVRFFDLNGRRSGQAGAVYGTTGSIRQINFFVNANGTDSLARRQFYGAGTTALTSVEHFEASRLVQRDIYDAQGQIPTVEFYDPEGQSMGTATFISHPFGRLAHIEIRNATGQLIETRGIWNGRWVVTLYHTPETGRINGITSQGNLSEMEMVILLEEIYVFDRHRFEEEISDQIADFLFQYYNNETLLEISVRETVSGLFDILRNDLFDFATLPNFVDLILRTTFNLSNASLVRDEMVRQWAGFLGVGIFGPVSSFASDFVSRLLSQDLSSWGIDLWDQFRSIGLIARSNQAEDWVVQGLGLSGRARDIFLEFGNLVLDSSQDGQSWWSFTDDDLEEMYQGFSLYPSEMVRNLGIFTPAWYEQQTVFGETQRILLGGVYGVITLRPLWLTFLEAHPFFHELGHLFGDIMTGARSLFPRNTWWLAYILYVPRDPNEPENLNNPQNQLNALHSFTAYGSTQWYENLAEGEALYREDSLDTLLDAFDLFLETNAQNRLRILLAIMQHYVQDERLAIYSNEGEQVTFISVQVTAGRITSFELGGYLYEFAYRPNSLLSSASRTPLSVSSEVFTPTFLIEGSYGATL